MKNVLTPGERDSSAWQKLRAHIEDRIIKTQAEINKPGSDHATTEANRYLLKELNLMLTLEREPITVRPVRKSAASNSPIDGQPRQFPRGY